MVFVVDTEHRPLSPCHPARARRLLAEGKAAVWRRYPFTIILKRAISDAQPAPLRLKLDPGSKTTGLALVHDGTDGTGQIVWAGELIHRGQRIRGRVVVRASGRFDVVTATEKVQGISHRYCHMVAHSDGYAYSTGSAGSKRGNGASSLV